VTTRAELDAILRALETMPAFLQRAARTLEGQAARRPSGGGFSIVEHAWHLADLEREGFGERIRRLSAEADPDLPDFDGARVARERDYRSRSLPEGLVAFAAARAANLGALRSTFAESWSRSGRQEGVGAVRLGDIPRLMREHDDSHRAEIAALVAEAAPGS
jgi:hypothetical protein